MSNTDIKRQIGHSLKQRRIARGLTQTALGKLVGKHRTDYSAIERGKRNIKLETLYKLCTVLGVRMWELLLESEGLTDSATSPPASAGGLVEHEIRPAHPPTPATSQRVPAE